jgi:hypothetical protein
VGRRRSWHDFKGPFQRSPGGTVEEPRTNFVIIAVSWDLEKEH